MNIEFECKELSINDDPNFGCTIEFNDTLETHDENRTIEELLHPAGKYLLIQRSYQEEEYDMDWYTIESSEAAINYTQQYDMYVRLKPKEFEMYCAGVTFHIGLNLTGMEYANLEKMLRTRFKGKVVMLKDR
ncbi:MAG: hypothetical protein K9I94_04285 [Bacteroidales bacterium]|nr:hypothetical protein [Bacteroidales bacterium]